MDIDKIIEDIETIQDRINEYNFKGQNEYDLHLRIEIAEYIKQNFDKSNK